MRVFENDWVVLEPLLAHPTMQALKETLKKELSTHEIFPPSKDVFNALHLTPLSKVKVVILGQDPYHGKGQAHGLSFSVRQGTPKPPSLENIHKELAADLGIPPPASPDLTPWAREGVLLLNATLTVRAGQPQSHQGLGWEFFTSEVLRTINEQKDFCVFILWGASARAHKASLNLQKHAVIESAHPSPLSAARGFFGSRPFSRANALLVSHGLSPVNWNLP